MKTKLLKPFFFGLFLCATTLPCMAQTATTTTAGNWNVGSNWSTGTVPGGSTPVVVSLPMNINQNISLSAKYIFNANSSGTHVLNMSGDSLIINANVGFNSSGNNLSTGVILVKSGDTLTIGDINTSGGLKIVIEAGATMIVNGSINNNGATIQVDGTLKVTGSYSAANSSGNITGQGNFTTTGGMGAMNGGTIFGNTNPSCSSSCDGNNLCGTTVSITPVSSSICSGKNVSFSSSASPTPVSYKWQSSAASSGFSDIGGATTNAYSDASASTTYYRLQVTVGSCVTSSAATKITVNANPANPTAPDVSRCGSGTVALGATGSSGNYNWYSDASGTTLLTTGNSYTTTSISTSTPYYVTAYDNVTSCESGIVTVNAVVQTCTDVTDPSYTKGTYFYSSNKKLFVHTLSGGALNVYNLQGQLVTTQEIQLGQGGDTVVEMDNVHPGVYHVTVKTNEGMVGKNVYIE